MKENKSLSVFSEFMCAIIYAICQKFYYEGEHREETYSYLQSILMERVKLPIHTAHVGTMAQTLSF